ncbi:glycosyl hydrolase family 28-related protein [Ureibacillus thermosphaericus]|uniref:Rhamnogalacturonase A/B/Epimerase-like pectate lyase domain-containing protein n=1 Tax=Ureibacillus thermosphaericus TaxID=51173 RepID=A0A840PQH1_URETH|nr:glycosyl hydrolase family 28-related protein [Ureibacillus thermosphaericus]MBB5148160.1 hypothetical protein [Ureibacillus thermosphaericus]NKZ31071.1 hypothetical protein [Ureibacillus thermosphaericus]
MASETTNYKLVKPDPEEFYDVGVQNSNLDKIDTALKELEDSKASNVNLISLEQTVNEHLADFAVNVKDFGAVGDGINNDQPAIQAAIDYAHANKKNVYIPNGKYRLEDTIKRKGNVSLYGKSMTETELIFANVSGGVIIDTVNESLHGVTIQDVKLSKENNVAGNVIGILGGSTLELYNSAIGTFRNIQIVGLTHGISGNGVPDGVGIFDCLFENIVISSCFIGLRLHGSGNVVIHPRIVLCDTGVTLEYLNGESFAGVKFVNGVFVQNGYDIGITNVNGIRPSSFNGTWFEQAEHGIINIPYENTKIMSLSFNDCMLNVNSELELMNFYNALGVIKIDNCTIFQTNNSSTNIVNPASKDCRLKVANTIKILNNGDRSFLNYYIGDEWKQLDLVNGWVHVNENSLTKYFKTDDNIVHLQIAMKDGTPNGDTVIGTLPIGYRPKQSIRFTVLDVTNGVLRHLYITNTGNIGIQSIPSIQDLTGVWVGYVTFKADL